MRSTGSSGNPSPYSPYLTGAPAGTPRLTPTAPAGTPAGLTPNAPAGTPAGLTPNAPAGTPAGTGTPHPGARSPRNERAHFFGTQPGITGLAVLENLGARLARESTSGRKEAMEEGSDSLDRLVDDDGDKEFAEYEKLKDEPKKLAEKIAQLVFGSTIDPSLDHNNERLKSLFDLGFMENSDDRKLVRDKAFQNVKMMDGSGIIGLTGHEDENAGAASLLEPESRTCLFPATKCMLNMLEHGQWTSQILASSADPTPFGGPTPERGGTPSQAGTPHDGSAAELPTINVTASTGGPAASPSALDRDNKRAASPNPLEEGEQRAAGRSRES
jgi:hypothetical protein